MKTNLQRLIAIVLALKKKFSRIYNRFQGYCPTSDEIENGKIKSLANRLKTDSQTETITNILDWQEQNVTFWTERHPISSLFLTILACICWGIPIIIAVLFIIIFIAILLKNQMVLVWLLQVTIWFIQNTQWFIAIFASSIVALLATMISILRSNRKFSWKEIPKALKNTFTPNVSIDFLLENKLGVCRDYAKLTACLLSNIYPTAEIYFVNAPHHVATGIKIGNRLYMLDQRLPILTIDRWIEYRKHRKNDKIERFDPIKNSLQKVVDNGALLQTKNRPQLNTERLAKKMVDLLNIKKQIADGAISLEIPWKNGVILYEEDELVDYSLARWLKRKISNELIKINRITKIEIKRQKDDLIFLIH